MRYEELTESYKSALRLAKQSFMKRVASGGSGYLPSLDGIVKNADIISEVDIGTHEIPLKKIIGAASHSRAISFARNFLPMQDEMSEFATKWMKLYEAHLTEGIRDSISCFEYLNWFYVREGNKRVSVLKYTGAYSINAEVRRILPKRDPSDMTNTIYYEFLDFNRLTSIFTIWFSRPGRFPRLIEMLESYAPNHVFSVNKYEHFMINVYMPFAELYHELGGDKLDITTADALLTYITVYGIPQCFIPAENRSRIKKMFSEFETLNHESSINLITQPLKASSDGVINTLARRMTNKKLKAGFVYAKTPASSGWTNAHEQGRQHIISMMGDYVETYKVEEVPQDKDAYLYIKELADKGMDVIFTTSPTFNQATLKAAIEYPRIKFFNCSSKDSFKNVRTFFGRIHEVRFLLGLIAGALTKTGYIGYVATYPISEVISGINAFAIGAAMTNPFAKIHVRWMYRWENETLSYKAAAELTKEGADLICQDDLPIVHMNRKAYGLFSTICDLETGECTPHKHYAIPIWHWGVFYEKILNNI
ncbi:MAG: BMP family ABC transporter substrate-binding protein, partial [Spirochaetota bacterium]